MRFASEYLRAPRQKKSSQTILRDQRTHLRSFKIQQENCEDNQDGQILSKILTTSNI